MKRRVFLSVTALALGSGCLNIGGTAEGFDSIADYEFTIYESSFDRTTNFPGPTEQPIVSFKPESKQVIVRGALFVGSSTCNKADLKDVSYSETSQTLTVKVGSTDTSSWFSGSCTGDESADAYRLVVTMKEQLPTTVRVKQTGSSAKSVTVRRP
ncbi:hypothetical protein [Haladaptatus sp. W1]|uniref:hypothetical protein n=1 Tax=Haladaptatus sp. W1 TaxID=1897478 RepID=UPI001112DDF1|nr:hypothetical protein [Haladaptatus sp. W1]